jgi:hypothetical protein
MHGATPSPVKKERAGILSEHAEDRPVGDFHFRDEDARQRGRQRTDIHIAEMMRDDQARFRE